MKVLVTGGGGFLGTYIIKELLSRGYEVTNLSRKSYPHLTELGVDTLKADLSIKEELDSLNLDDFGGVFHVAALAGVWGSYEKYFKINYEGTKNLVGKIKKSGIKFFVYTSTPSVVFGKDDIAGADESIEFPKGYLTAYAKTKSMAENFVLGQVNDSFHSLAIRPHLIWGPGDPHILPRLKEKARQGKLKRVGDGENLVDIIYVENAACAHVDAFEKLLKDTTISGSAYFIGQERPVKLWEFINTLLVKSDCEQVEDSISFKMAYRIGYVFEKVFSLIGIQKPEPPMTRFVATQLAKSHYFSHEKAKNDFGYIPKITIEEGLERTFKTDLLGR